ncbi:MAG: hypothetical protein HOP18_12990 [Deltaproteobacteria bacterium]|nr:hypothetical protein [Deltaproteobacteria bacterium]
MTRMLWAALLLCGTLLVGLSSFGLADHHDDKEGKEGNVTALAPLFPHVPGSRWVYALSGPRYPQGGELHVRVQGYHFLPALNQQVLLFEETHLPATAADVPKTTPVLYYARDGFLVRDPSHVYADRQRTRLIATDTFGEAVAPVLPLWRHLDGSDWNPVDVDHWGKTTTVDIEYHINPRKRVSVTVQGREYQDCVIIEGAVTRTPGESYNYYEWYAPGIGMVKRVMAELKTGHILATKELVSFQTAAPNKEQTS